MKSIEVIVPRKLISEFYPHPEFYGDFVVKLVNGMYTDLYYRDEAEFITITNDEELIEYLDNQNVQPFDYLFRNGVFAFRKIETDEKELLKSWSSIYAKHKIKRILNHKNVNPLPERIVATYYCIDFGIVEFDFGDESHIFTLLVYDNRWIDELDTNVCMDILEEYLSEKQSEN